MRSPPDTPLFERTPEVEAIGALLGAAERRDGGALLLQGAAGVGKTRLLQIACEEARRAGALVMRACGDALERDFPWGVAVQLFGELASDRGPAEDPFEGQAAVVRPLLEQARDPVAVRTDPFPLLHGLYWLAVNLADRAPLLLVVDDLHWSDTHSLRMMCYLLRRLEGTGIAVLMAVRAGEPVSAEVDGLLARIAADDAVATRTLRPLSSASIGRLVRTQLPAASDGFCDALATAVGGNPFLCAQLVATVRAEGMVPDDHAAAGLRVLRPAGVRQAILVRLGQLGPAAAAVAAAVAVLGTLATPRLTAAVAGLDATATATAIDRLTAAAVLSDRQPLTFLHPIVREVVLADLGPARRRQDHVAAARALHADEASAADVAAHLLQADVVAEAWVVAALRAAAALDIGRAAPGRAAELLRLALDANPDAHERAGILLALGGAEAAAGEPTAVERFEEAMRLPAPQGSSARIAAQLGEALYAAGRFADAARAFAEGLELLPEVVSDDDQTVEARLLAGIDNAAVMGGRRPHNLRQRMATLAADPPSHPSQADRVLMATAAGRHALAGDLPSGQVVRLADAALAGGQLPEVLGRIILEPVTAALMFCDKFDQAMAILGDVIAGASARGEMAAYAGLLPLRAVCALRGGHLAAAEADAADALRLAEELPGASRQALAPARRVLALTALVRGDLASASAAVDVPDASQLWGDSPIHGWYLDAAGRVALEQGDPAGALGSFQTAGEVFTTAGGPGTFCDWRSGAGLALHRLGRPAEALAMVEDELERATAFGAPRGIAIALRCKAQLLSGDASTSIDLLRGAAATLEHSPARLEQALVQVDLGAALRRAGHRREARGHLRDGLALARGCGALVLSQLASDELAASGARRPDLALTGVEALTPSELRVARLACEGQTNRQIAEALFVTRKTVEVHLSSTYRKLQISSREGLSEHLG